MERGFGGVTIEGIATRAGVTKQTIYRWWPSKTHVLMDALLEDALQELAPPDTGDLAVDLREQLGALAQFLTQSDAGAVFRTLTGQAQHDLEVAHRLRSDFLTRQRERERVPVRRALASVGPVLGADLDLLLDQFVGPIYYRALVSGSR